MTMTTEVQQGFDERFVEVINSAALALMVSIGHRTGLFDVMEGAQPMTSVELAEASGLDERYVREWLSAMATGRVVELDVPSASFWLPAERAQWLTRSAGADNLARIAQYISVLGAVEDDIVRCFHEGGGVPYERFARFHEVMMEESGAGVRDSLEEHVLPIVPGLGRAARAGHRRRRPRLRPRADADPAGGAATRPARSSASTCPRLRSAMPGRWWPRRG